LALAQPNGPFYDNATGLYHLFAQYNPHGAKRFYQTMLVA
jgi:sucrose-6-phosphate hydrolase SacC (GH32 family)